MSETFLFLINPASGAEASRNQILETVRQGLRGYHLQVHETTGMDDISQIRTLAVQSNWKGILVGGGDGTINMVSQAIEEVKLPIGIIPMGSANGLATCLDISDVKDTISAIRSGNTKLIDVLKINGKLCLHLADFGFNAGMIKRFDEGNERGMFAYFKSSFREFLEIRPYRFMVAAGGREQAVEARMIVIANGDKYGTKAIINPQSAMDDGKMDIIAINPQGLDDMVSISIALFRQTIKELPFVSFWSAKSATIGNPDGATFQIDGEVIDNTPKVDIICEPGKIQFFVPQKEYNGPGEPFV